MSICPRCGAAFECGVTDACASSAPCWCARMPALPLSAYLPDSEDPAAGRCLCPYCLRSLLTVTGLEPGDE